VDSDFRQSTVHRPLQDGIGTSHFRLDAIQQRGQVEPFGAPHDSLGGEAPSGACRSAVVSNLPFLAKSFLVGVLLDDVGVEPVRHISTAPDVACVCVNPVWLAGSPPRATSFIVALRNVGAVPGPASHLIDAVNLLAAVRPVKVVTPASKASGPDS
jgi:hypothetical protein